MVGKTVRKVKTTPKGGVSMKEAVALNTRVNAFNAALQLTPGRVDERGKDFPPDVGEVLRNAQTILDWTNGGPPPTAPAAQLRIIDQVPEQNRPR